jgi:hypothetical protein
VISHFDIIDICAEIVSNTGRHGRIGQNGGVAHDAPIDLCQIFNALGRLLEILKMLNGIGAAAGLGSVRVVSKSEILKFQIAAPLSSRR